MISARPTEANREAGPGFQEQERGDGTRRRGCRELQPAGVSKAPGDCNQKEGLQGVER